MAEKRGREERERGGKIIGIKKRIIIGRKRKGFTLILISLILLSPVSPTAVTSASLAARAETPSMVKLSPYKKKEKKKAEKWWRKRLYEIE